MLLSEKLSDLLSRVPDDVESTDELDKVDYGSVRTQLSIAIVAAKEVEAELEALEAELAERTERKVKMTESYIRVRDMSWTQLGLQKDIKPKEEDTTELQREKRLADVKNALANFRPKK